MLSDEQIKFINNYCNSRGDYYGTLELMGLSVYHFLAWCENPIFKETYAKVKRQVIENLRDENHQLGLLRLNDILINGVEQKTIQQKHIVKGTNSSFITTRTTKNLGIPGWAILAAIEKTKIEKAIDALADEGVLPREMAIKVIDRASRISDDIRETLASNSEAMMNESRAIALIKQAVLGAVNE